MDDIIGRKFGRLTVLSFDSSDRHGKKYLCECECGTKCIKYKHTLLAGTTRSCGCLAKEVHHKIFFKHGKPKLYKKWLYMKNRCYNKNASAYHYYGGRGITVDYRWINDYEAFKKWSEEHGYKDGLSLDRIDPTQGYSPDNCRWVELSEQPKNRRNCIKVTYNGRTEIVSEWARILKVDSETLRYHVKKYGDMERYMKNIYKGEYR